MYKVYSNNHKTEKKFYILVLNIYFYKNIIFQTIFNSNTSKVVLEFSKVWERKSPVIRTYS